MQDQTIMFVSRNKFKLQEARKILAPASIEVVPLLREIDEIQSDDIEAIVRNKVTNAFRLIGRSLFVEQTGLFLDRLNGLPGGLTQVFWDALQADRFSELFGGTTDLVRAVTVIGYTDCKEIFLFRGEVAGVITAEPRGSRDFQWDCVFQPTGYDQTFADLGDMKNEISMRRKALDDFAGFLRGRSN